MTRNPDVPHRLLREQFEQELSDLEDLEGSTWSDLGPRDQELVVAAMAASRKWFGGNQCFVVKHNDTKPGSSTTCSGDVFAFIENNDDVTYKCQSCGKNWPNASL